LVLNKQLKLSLLKVDDFKFASILTGPAKFLIGLEFATQDLKFNC
jgi:hypothetical protein